MTQVTWKVEKLKFLNVFVQRLLFLKRLEGMNNRMVQQQLQLISSYVFCEIFADLFLEKSQIEPQKYKKLKVSVFDNFSDCF